jgi:hypothetical protein
MDDNKSKRIRKTNILIIVWIKLNSKTNFILDRSSKLARYLHLFAWSKTWLADLNCGFYFLLPNQASYIVVNIQRTNVYIQDS